MNRTSEGDATLVLAAYNHARFIPDAVASFAAQDHGGLHLIVTDDASTDDSCSVIEAELNRHGIRATKIFHTDNAGICATFNEALRLVDTEFVAFLSADDWMTADRFSRQLRAMRSAPKAALAYSDASISRDGETESLELLSDFWGDRWPAGQHDDLYLQLIKTSWIPAPSVLSRTEALRQVGGYDEALPYEDYDMWLRLAAHGYDFVYIDEPLVTWRRVEGSLTETLNDGPAIARDLTDLQILGKHLGVRRDIDAELAPRLFLLAVTLRKRGSRSPIVARTLRACLKADPGLAALWFAVSSTLTQRRGND